VDVEEIQERCERIFDHRLPQVLDRYENVEDRAQVDVSVSRDLSGG
jgi:hypothetical protein